MIGFESPVGIPSPRTAGPMLDLNETDSPFDKPPRGQELHTKVTTMGLVDPVEGLGLCRLLRKVDHFGDRSLHSKSQFVRSDSSRKGWIVGVLQTPLKIQFPDQIRPDRLGLGIQSPLGSSEVQGSIRIDFQGNCVVGWT